MKDVNRIENGILKLLSEADGTWVSGEEIGVKLGVTRAAVSKYVGALRERDFPIISERKKGYKALRRFDAVTESDVLENLVPDSWWNVEVLDETDSTNSYLKRKWADAKGFASDNPTNGSVCIARRQTAGRGRLGRSFYSPDMSGLYLSAIICPESVMQEDMAFLTVLTSVAVCEAIEKVGGVFPKIKWVNDLLLDGKKVCGILCEASSGLGEGQFQYVVFGVGVNVYAPIYGFGDLSDIATSLFDVVPSSGFMGKLAAEILNNLQNYIKNFDKGELYRKYKARNCVIGEKVEVIQGDVVRNAEALDIDEDCKLVVKFDDGHEEKLSFGEIKIKLK